MAKIQTTIGLMTGLPIVETVDKLIKVASKPRDLLVEQNKALSEQQKGIVELTALLASVQYIAKNLAKPELFSRRTATSSQPDTLEVAVTGSPAVGQTTVRPVRMASAQQWISSGVESTTTPLGGGKITWRFGPNLAEPMDLSHIRGGAGFVPGSVRITDRSGASAIIDLSAAQTLGDVLQAINQNTQVTVAASIRGDSIALTDLSGGPGRLRVQEVGSQTAASLGLAGINVEGDTAIGTNIVWLSESMPLSVLNDGRGVRFNRYVADLDFTLRDGTQGQIDLAPLVNGTVSEPQTIGDLLRQFNEAAPGKLQLEISSDGKRFVLRDLTEGSGQLQIQALHDSRILSDLGLSGTPQEGQILGRRVLGGLGSPLIATLNGGRGLGPLGSLRLTDRQGGEATVDLTSAETVADILEAINGAGLKIQARLNSARTGIELLDTSENPSGPLVIASADELQTAEKLGLAASGNLTRVNSGDLHRQIIRENTPLSQLQGGRGVQYGSFTIIDSRGNSQVVRLSASNARTVGDVLSVINGLGLSVRAEINPTGDGIRLVDYGGGSAQLRVLATGFRTASDLNLLRDRTRTQINGEEVQIIDGAMTYSVELSSGETLADLQRKINQQNAGLAAVVINDGSSRPYRLSLQSLQAGRLGSLVIDIESLPFDIREITPGQDALLALGTSNTSGVLVRSSNNSFQDVIPGVSITIKKLDTEPVRVTVRSSETDVVASTKLLVDNYNRFQEKLTELTFFDPQSNKRGPLQGDILALRLQSDLGTMLTQSIAVEGRMVSLREMGIEIRADGKLSLDESRLRTAFQENPQAVQRFFAGTGTGFAVRLDRLLQQLAGEQNSMLGRHLETVQRKIANNEQKIDQLEERLERQRQRLLAEFYRADLLVGKMQSQIAIVEKIQPMTWYFNRRTK